MGVGDAIDDGHQTVRVSVNVFRSSDKANLVENWTTESNYNNLSPYEFNVVNADNDTAGLTIRTLSNHTTESGQPA